MCLGGLFGGGAEGISGALGFEPELDARIAALNRAFRDAPEEGIVKEVPMLLGVNAGGGGLEGEESGFVEDGEVIIFTTEELPDVMVSELELVSINGGRRSGFISTGGGGCDFETATVPLVLIVLEVDASHGPCFVLLFGNEASTSTNGVALGVGVLVTGAGNGRGGSGIVGTVMDGGLDEFDVETTEEVVESTRGLTERSIGGTIGAGGETSSGLLRVRNVVGITASSRVGR